MKGLEQIYLCFFNKSYKIIGFTVLACAYALGGVSGGAFNPAVAFGISLAEMKLWSNIWIFLVGNLAGGAAAAYAFLYINGRD